MIRPHRPRLGQHFLFDPAILDRIALATGSIVGVAVIEVGPGPGGLTRALLDAGAHPVVAVEIDTQLAVKLRTWPEARTGGLAVVHADALRIDWTGFAVSQGIQSARIIANLPYKGAARLIVDWLGIDSWRREMAVMVQKEVAERLCARVGTAAYGRLSVLAQATTRPRIEFTLPPGAFRPSPRVDSALVVMEPRISGRHRGHWDDLLTVTSAAFGQRRKMLRVSLRSLFSGGDPVPMLRAAGIAPTRRPQTLSRPEFGALVRAYAEMIGPTGN